jgi:LCP family protein required for cell wall assembly
MIGGMAAIFVLATAISAYLVFTTVRDLVAGWQITSFSSTPFPGGNGHTNSGASTPSGGTPAPGATPGPVATVPQHTWTDAGRVTVLVMGIDRRVGEDEKGYLTDSLMLLTVDPASKTAGMLSIPRDLWVEIPGYGMDTINTANRSGDYYSYPGGGPALALKTVQQNLGVTVNYYVRIDFTAFETFIDAIGGIDVNNETTIDDPQYPNGSYGYEPFYLEAGPQHLNGHDALRYARTRHNSTDIDRARRQQQVVMAVRDRVLNLNMLPTLIAQAPGLYQTLNNSIWTNLTLEQMVSLALLGQEIPRGNIQSAVIDYRYVLEYTTPEGRQVLVPLRDKIRELRDALFSATAIVTPVSSDEKAAMVAERASVAVLNGAGIEGLAKTTADWLAAQGMNVTAIDTADRSDYANTVIIVYHPKPATELWLKKTFNVAAIVTGNHPNRLVDVQIIVGQDWQAPPAP